MEVTRVFDLLEHQLRNSPKPDNLARKTAGKWITYSTQTYKETADRLSLGFLALNIAKDDKIALVSHNRPEWNFVDMACQQIGAVSVPMYPTITVEDYQFILNDSGAKIVFVANRELYDKVIEAIQNFEVKPAIYSFDRLPGVSYWEEIKETGKAGNPASLDAYRDAVQPNDLLTLIYTSGTTGKPKGVMLSHDNIVSNFKACFPLMPTLPGDRALSFLPLCHVYERMLSYLYQYTGISIYYAESLETIADNLKEVKPHIFVTVPRLLEKVYDKIVAKGTELTGIKRALFFWALELGQKYDTQKPGSWWYEFQLYLANKIIFKKWREALGGNIKAVVSGGAALQPRLARVFWAGNIKVMEGYGLTETSPVIAVNRVDRKENMIGTVGPLIEGVSVKIAEDGEILSKGRHIMLGYYKRPDLTAEVIDAEGWFHTGDIGTLVDGKYLKITDRKKEMFKTSGGKYVAPQLLENKLKESKVIEQAMVVGDGRKFPAALIVPNFAALKDYCEYKNIPYTTDEMMVHHPDVINKFERDLEKANNNFAQWEKIKKFHLCTRVWTIEAGEMTAKLSLKRRVLMEKFSKEIEQLYQN